MSVIQAIQQLIRDWSIDIYGGWSIWDIVGLHIVIIGTVAIANYFFFKAGS